MKLKGKVWKINGNCRATDLVPARYDYLFSKRQFDECAKHILEDLVPNFVSEFQKGDIILVDGVVGIGHNHYHPAAIFGSKAAGVGAILSESVNPLFQHQAIDGGFFVFPFKGISALFENGHELEVDLKSGDVKNITTGKSAQFNPTPQIILDILEVGGSEKWALNRVGAID